MSKPLPTCYCCGKTIVRKPRIIFEFHGNKFAWHIDCSKTDKYFDIACKMFSGKIYEYKGLAMLLKSK